MLFSNLSFLWNNIYKNIEDTIKLNGFENILKKFNILSINDNTIVIFSCFHEISSLFNQNTLNIINNIIKDNIKLDKDPIIKYQPNYVPEVTININQTLDSFIINSENRLSIAVAKKISSDNSKNIYSPLFLYSDTGMGKSHIVNGIVLEYTNNFPNDKILYYSGESFITSYFEAVKNNLLNEWKSYNKRCNLFIIDDIHILENNENAINEFNLIFDNLYSNYKKNQIVITSNKSPEKLHEFSNSLKGKLQWGVKLEILSHNKSTKEDIVKSILKKYNLNCDYNLISYIANNCQNNVREVEGLIKTLFTHSTLLNEEINIKLINKVIGNKTPKKTNHSISGEDILYNVCQFFNISEIDIKSKNRSRAIAYPRQIGMYLTKHLINASLQEIGKIYGGRDHSTVKHSNDKIKKLYKLDIKVKNTINHLIKQINNEHIYQ